MSAREIAERLRNHRKVSKVQTDEGPVYVRGLSGAERKAWIEASVKDASLVDQRLVAMALCDENGSPLFDGDQSFEVVCDWDVKEVVSPVALEIMKLSGMEKKAVEDAEKKSEASRS